MFRLKGDNLNIETHAKSIIIISQIYISVQLLKVGRSHLFKLCFILCYFQNYIQYVESCNGFMLDV